MCFSATASFVSCAVLGVTGLASIQKANDKTKMLLAATPVLFSLQQLMEGFVWVSLSGIEEPPWKHYMIMMYLIFALVIWPVWVSFSVLAIETIRLRKIFQILCLLCGLTFAVFASYYLSGFIFDAKIKDSHILYELDFPNKKNPLTALLYFTATVIPLLISSVKKVPWLGVMIFGSYLVTKLIFNEFIISVWCFFAAGVSVTVYVIMSDYIKSFKAEKTMVQK